MFRKKEIWKFYFAIQNMFYFAKFCRRNFTYGALCLQTYRTRSIWKMLGPFDTASRLTPIHQVSLAVLSLAACASMSTTTTTTTTRDRGDRYGPMEWAQWSVDDVVYVLFSKVYFQCESGLKSCRGSLTVKMDLAQWSYRPRLAVAPLVPADEVLVQWCS